MWPVLLKFLPLLILLAWAAAVDLRSRRIPNWLTLLMLLSGVAQSCRENGTVTLTASLLGILAGAAVPLVLFAMGALGGGDVKLMAGIGAWMGPLPAIAVLILEKVIGLVIVLTQATLQGRTRVLLRNSAVVALNILYVKELGLEHAVETGKCSRSIDRPLPFAVPVLLAVVAVLAKLGSQL